MMMNIVYKLGKGCLDQIFNLRQIGEEALEREETKGVFRFYGFAKDI